MRTIMFMLSAAAVFSLAWLANQHQPFGTALPALGPLLSPYSGFWRNAEPAAAPPDLALSFPQLKGDAEVVFDQRLVPHIFAEHLEDAAFIQGYLAAKYRLWQMDIAIRATAGRLSEVVGERALEHDLRQRRKGMGWAAAKAVEAWQRYPEEWALIQAYTNGANAYIEMLRPADYPVEFKLMGYAPEPWSPLKSALFFKSMAETLSSRNEDVEASNVYALLGDSLYHFLFPEHNPRQSPIIPADVEWAFEPVPVAPAELPATPAAPTMLSRLIPELPFPPPPPFLGSNNWAIAGEKSATGRPMLCNDPHLKLSLPSIWYEVQIQTPESNAYGVSFPGLPGLLIGFNEHIAWGVTNGSQDVLDWYRITWADESKEAYMLDGQPRGVDKLVEVIKVRGRSQPMLDTVRYTTWGPVVYEAPGHPYEGLAMRWLAHDAAEDRPFTEVGTFLRLMKAKSFDDYQKALVGFDNPAQNFVFAHKDGDIAMAANGRLPLKQPQQGVFVQDGSTAESGWAGFIPREHLPAVHNPQRGFVSSANQHNTAPDYPYYYNGYYDGYRGRLINRKLEEMQGATIEDMKALQLENYSLKAEEALPLLLGLLDRAAPGLGTRPEIKMLEDWDYRFEKDALAPPLFERWLREARRLAFDEIYAWEDSIPVIVPEYWRFLELLENHPGHPIFDHQDTPETEQASHIVTQAFQKVLEEYDGQPWAAFKGTSINHLGNISPFSRQGLDVGGYRDAPNAISEQNGPSWRMVVALGEEVEAYGIYPGGQSGNPGSRYYENMVDDWMAGQYYRLLLLKQADETPEQRLFTLSFYRQN
jgi:penicillin G amidase